MLGREICCKNITELADSLYENCWAFNFNLALLILTTVFWTVLFPLTKNINLCVVVNSWIDLLIVRCVNIMISRYFRDCVRWTIGNLSCHRNGQDIHQTLSRNIIHFFLPILRHIRSRICLWQIFVIKDKKAVLFIFCLFSWRWTHCGWILTAQ